MWFGRSEAGLKVSNMLINDRFWVAIAPFLTDPNRCKHVFDVLLSALVPFYEKSGQKSYSL